MRRSDILGYKKTVKPSLDLVFDRVHPEDLKLLRETLDRASKDQNGFELEHKLFLPDGAVKHVHVYRAPVQGRAWECRADRIGYGCN